MSAPVIADDLADELKVLVGRINDVYDRKDRAAALLYSMIYISTNVKGLSLIEVFGCTESVNKYVYEFVHGRTKSAKDATSDAVLGYIS